MWDTSANVVGANTGPGVIHRDHVTRGDIPKTLMWAHLGLLEALKASRGQAKHNGRIKSCVWHIRAGWKYITTTSLWEHPENTDVGSSGPLRPKQTMEGIKVVYGILE